MTELITEVGRIVSGHPMIGMQVSDDNGTKLFNADGSPKLSFYTGLAVPKGTETDWKQTQWGQLLYNEAVRAFPNGEYNWPNFSWKVIDGDSQIPNQKGKIPCQREGWPGNWILNIKNGFPFSSN